MQITITWSKKDGAHEDGESMVVLIGFGLCGFVLRLGPVDIQ